MKRLSVIRELESAIKHIDNLILRAKGKESSCAVKNLSEVPTYLDTWVRWNLITALELVKKK